MRKIKLYIATSLDGFIAGKNGALEWLVDFPNPMNTDYGYAEFYRTVDTTLIGHRTYKEIAGFEGPFPYKDKTNFVFTRTAGLPDTEEVKFVCGDLLSFLNDLKSKPGKDIWLVGGGQLNTTLLQYDLIDEMTLHIIPVVLGDGIQLFPGLLKPFQFKLKKEKTYDNGVLELNYVK